MAILEILQYPDSRLNTPAQRVEKIDAATRKLIENMAETIYAAPRPLHARPRALARRLRGNPRIRSALPRGHRRRRARGGLGSHAAGSSRGPRHAARIERRRAIRATPRHSSPEARLAQAGRCRGAGPGPRPGRDGGRRLRVAAAGIGARDSTAR